MGNSLEKAFQGLYLLSSKQPSRDVLLAFSKRLLPLDKYLDAQYSCKQAFNRRFAKMNLQLYFLILIVISNFGTNYAGSILLDCKEDDESCGTKDTYLFVGILTLALYFLTVGIILCIFCYTHKPWNSGNSYSEKKHKRAMKKGSWSACCGPCLAIYHILGCFTCYFCCWPLFCLLPR